MRAVILFVLLLVACDSQAGPPPMNVEIDAPAGAEQAFDFAVAAWELRLGPPAHRPDDTVPRVRWFAPRDCVHANGKHGPCLEYDNLRDASAGTIKVSSMYWPLNAAIHVTALTSPRPSGSGLAHEVLHWILASSGRGADRDHVLPIWDDARAVRDEMIGAGL